MTMRRPMRATSSVDLASARVERAVACGIDASGRLLVRLSNEADPRAVAVVSSFCDADVHEAVHRGDTVLVVIESEDRSAGIALGRVRHRISSRLETAPTPERIEVTGISEVVLRAGKATIILRSDGRILIRGTEIASSASGTNRIRGGAIKLN